MLVGAREPVGVGRAVGVRAVEVAGDGDRRNGDRGPAGERPLEPEVALLALREAQPPAVVVDHDVDVVRVVERRRGAVEGGVVDVPLRRGDPPDQPGELARVAPVAEPAPLGREVEQVPPAELGLRRQRLLVDLDAPDQVAAHRDQGRAALGPERGHDRGGPRSPVEPGDGRPCDPEGVQQRQGVDGEHRLLAVARGPVGQEPRAAVAAQVGHDHPAPLRDEQRCDLVVGVDVVGPAVQEQDGGAVLRAGVDVADVEVARVDLLDLHPISRLAEGEHVGLGARVEEGDLEGAVGDRTGLADQLVQPRLGRPSRGPRSSTSSPRAPPGGFPSSRTTKRTGPLSARVPSTRLRSRPRKRYTIRPPGSFRVVTCGPPSSRRTAPTG